MNKMHIKQYKHPEYVEWNANDNVYMNEYNVMNVHNTTTLTRKLNQV